MAGRTGCWAARARMVRPSGRTQFKTTLIFFAAREVRPGQKDRIASPSARSIHFFPPRSYITSISSYIGPDLVAHSL
jgi:hypothetical protein